jgi:hypothetical protein
MKKLPDHLSRECIIAAIRAYDAGVAHQFKSARLYEIEFEGRRYPSKAIVGLAATLATGTEFTPADFSGGIKSKCVRLLLDQGFTIASQGAGDDEVALFPDEGQTTMEFVEGAAMQVVVNRYERDRQARQAARACMAAGVRYAVWIWPAAMAISARALSISTISFRWPGSSRLPSEP